MDDRIRKLERRALQGDSEALVALKSEWARSLSYKVCWVCEAHIPKDGWKEHF